MNMQEFVDKIRDMNMDRDSFTTLQLAKNNYSVCFFETGKSEKLIELAKKNHVKYELSMGDKFISFTFGEKQVVEKLKDWHPINQDFWSRPKPKAEPKVIPQKLEKVTEKVSIDKIKKIVDDIERGE